MKVPSTDKETKKWFKKIASKDPDKYYATSVLKERGFQRKECENCGTFFWTVNKDQKVCGDADCQGGFSLGQSSTNKKLDYIQVWKEFSKMFEKKGYSSMKRYPVVARWNPTMDFTIASIAAFQPYVVNGEVEAPAKKLVIPQFCLRFADVDNVGITMSHMTGFIMIGQHVFQTEEEWDQDQVFKDIFDWLTKGLGLPYEEITFHEDAWAGGGNYGPCMEYFSQGIELGNQVYMMYENHNGTAKELKLKVLDMGMGHERNAWFLKGEGTIYEATFPTVIEKLKKATGISFDKELMDKYVPYAPFLNLDEVEDIDEAWQRVSKKTGIGVGELKEKIEPATAIFSIAEHARALLFAIADGGLPSNIGGGYNLRGIFRRAKNFIDKYGWTVKMSQVAEWHAQYLKELFPELLENIADVKKVLEVEERKYYDNKKRSLNLIKNFLEKNDEKTITTEKIIDLYDSHGVSPELLKQEAKKLGKDVDKFIPSNFYSLVSEKHEQENIGKEQKVQTKKEHKYDLGGLPNTDALYFDAFDYVDFEAEVIKIIDGDKIILNRTAFYPTSGGQANDEGSINGVKVKDVFKQDGVIIHVLNKKVDFKVRDVVQGKIDFDRRLQLTQHHTSTHIINAAAKHVLGNHVWQGGAAKTIEKARIDITHYDIISSEEEIRIEKEANNIINKALPVIKSFMSKNLAEAEYGFRLYQGGAVPGKDIRVVNIGPGLDVEACGGTHLNNTSEAQLIKILKTSKIQDGLVRIEFVAGNAAKKLVSEKESLLEDVEKELGVSEEQIPAAVSQLFNNWKAVKKAKKKGQEFKAEWNTNSFEKFEGDSLAEAAKILKTQKEYLLKTILRFKKEMK